MLQQWLDPKTIYIIDTVIEGLPLIMLPVILFCFGYQVIFNPVKQEEKDKKSG